MTENNFAMDLAIEQGCDEAQKFIDKLRSNKQRDIGDIRLLDAFLRQIPIPPQPDRPIGALPLKGLGLGFVQPASQAATDIIVESSHVFSSGASVGRAIESDKQKAWNNVQALANKAGAKFPELVAAQWALESDFGKSLSGKNNYFGLKGKSGTHVATQEEVNGQMVTIDACFVDFNSAQDCINYLVKLWYKDYERYQGVNHQPTREAAAEALKAQGYATDSNYPEKLIDLMNQYAKVAAAADAPLWLPEFLGEGKAAAESGQRVDKDEVIQAVAKDLVASQVIWSDMNFQLTEHFALGEYLCNDHRRVPHEAKIQRNILQMIRELEKIRIDYGHAILITSGYRPAEINHEVGGVADSQHIQGLAVDICPADQGSDIREFQSWVDKNWYGCLGYGAKNGFVHIDSRNGKGWKTGGEKGFRWPY